MSFDYTIVARIFPFERYEYTLYGDFIQAKKYLYLTKTTYEYLRGHKV